MWWCALGRAPRSGNLNDMDRSTRNGQTAAAALPDVVRTAGGAPRLQGRRTATSRGAAKCRYRPSEYVRNRAYIRLFCGFYLDTLGVFRGSSACLGGTRLIPPAPGSPTRSHPGEGGGRAATEPRSLRPRRASRSATRPLPSLSNKRSRRAIMRGLSRINTAILPFLFDPRRRDHAESAEIRRAGPCRRPASRAARLQIEPQGQRRESRRRGRVKGHGARTRTALGAPANRPASLTC